MSRAHSVILSIGSFGIAESGSWYPGAQAEALSEIEVSWATSASGRRLPQFLPQFVPARSPFHPSQNGRLPGPSLIPRPVARFEGGGGFDSGARGRAFESRRAHERNACPT